MIHQVVPVNVFEKPSQCLVWTLLTFVEGE